MNEFEVGDKVEPRSASAAAGILRTDVERVITHVGDRWVLYTLGGVEQCSLIGQFLDRFQKVVPFFEKGKTYKCATTLFECTDVKADSDGTPVAVGYESFTEQSAVKTFVNIRREFGHWKEA